MTMALTAPSIESDTDESLPASEEGVEFHIGIDDTDSKLGGCTTYTAAIVFGELCRRRFVPLDFPWLVRLNPNVPWKTRGNGALALHFRCEDNRLREAKEIVKCIVERTSDPSIPSTDPAVVFLEGTAPPSLAQFSLRALHDVISVEEASRLAGEINAETHTFRGRRGLIGALAAIGSDMERDHSFEVIAYRTKENCGTKRRVDLDSVRKMDSKYYACTFNNLDPETGRVLVCPHGPDPVLLGIRGEDPLNLIRAFSEIVVKEPVERIMLFKTNHGTDAHLTRQRNAGNLRPHESALLTGSVETYPTVLIGGHVIFRIGDESGSVACATYQPTGFLRKIVRGLIPGDIVRVSGGVRLGPNRETTLNLEKLEVLGLVEDVKLEKPRCPKCEGSCETMGREQGFRCRRCGHRLVRGSARLVVGSRRIHVGTYIPPARAQRHLTRPVSRYHNNARMVVGDQDSTWKSFDEDYDQVLRADPLAEFLKSYPVEFRTETENRQRA